MTAASSQATRSNQSRTTPGGSSLGNPIVQALHEMAVSVLGEQLREMFEKADDILFDSAEKARGGDEQRLYLDTMRIVRVQRAKIIDAFQNSLRSALSTLADEVAESKGADPDDMSQWSLQEGDALEERIAVSNMSEKATNLHAHELVELQRRMTRLAELSGGALAPDAMAPARIIHAFQASMRDLSVDFPIKLVIYKLFDRVVVGRLSEVFVGANQLLAVHGIEPAVDARTDAKRAQQRPKPRAAMAGGAPAQPAWMSEVAPGTASGFGASAMGAGAEMAMPMGGAAMAGGFGAGSAGANGAWPGAAASAGGFYNDAVLVSEINQILSAYARGQRPVAPPWLPPENVALVAQMFDAYFRDPRLPDSLKPLLSRLQLPVLKSALADPVFFTQPDHPVRRATNDMFEMLSQFGSSNGSPSPQMVSELQGLVEALMRAFDLAPEQLRTMPATPVEEHVAETFIREQEEEQQKKNRARVERVRRIVAHELRRVIGERQLSSGIMRLMLSGFGPLLCLDYIRSGVDGASWTQTMGLVKQVLWSLEPGDLTAEQRAMQEAEIVAAISRRLAQIGFSEEKLETVVSGLLQAYLHRPEERASTAADGAVAQPGVGLSPEKELQGLLSILLVPGGWFTLVDTATQTKHWMRVRAYYPAQNAVLFGHYMEERYLRLRATSFATDLAEGRAAAIDPSPELQNAIGRIATLPFERSSEALAWIDGQDANAQQVH